jgi:small-conductance mechanosensitive channel/CRP-like cAMP-binding protein
MLALSSSAQSGLLSALIAPVLFLVTMGIGRWLKRRQGVRLGLMYFLFCATFSAYVPLAFFGHHWMPRDRPSAEQRQTAPLESAKGVERQRAELTEKIGALRNERPTEEADGRRTVLRHFEFAALVRHMTALVVLLATFFLMALLQRYFWEHWFERQQKTRPPKFLTQIFNIALFLAALALVASLTYGKDPTAFLFGSTVVVGIIGFAMQDLLGNIIAGIALEVGKPFKAGDWLVFEGQRAEVIEVNWRSTKLRTNDDVYIDLPNKNVASATLTNLTTPTPQHAVHVQIGLDYNVPPNLAKQCLIRATSEVAGVLASPPPKVFLAGYGDSAITYDVKFWTENAAAFNDLCDAVRTNIWYETQRSGIRIPFPIRTMQIERASKATNASGAAMTALQSHPVLQCLDPETLQQLFNQAQWVRFGCSEKIIRQGDEGRSMFILIRGEAHVLVNAQGLERNIATLRAGDCFGEMSLVTGEPRSATVIAVTDCELWEIHKHVLGEILQSNKTLVEKLGNLLAKRRLETEAVVSGLPEEAPLATKRKEYAETFLHRITSFFEL